MTIADRQSVIPSLGGGRFSLLLKLSLRELRGGFQGFYIFVACVALGVAAIGAVGTAAQALKSSLAREGQLILGGDIAVRLIHRQANERERNFLNSQGTVSEVMTMRAMVRTADGRKNSLVDLKAVDIAYPLFGTVRLRSGESLSNKLAGEPGVLVEPMVLERLDLSVGDQVKLGEAQLPILGVVEKEPD
ncbi:MAG: ABC transporter permease, partial [Methyloligellaceae bacterium]